MEKIVNIEGREIGLKASAGTVRRYRDAFGRDLIVDIGQAETEILEKKIMSSESTKIAENVVYIMAKEYDSSIPQIAEWLDDFSPYFVYSAIVHVITMWHENTKTINKSEKK